jgi:RNA polymerase sigma-70 factor (ECF subfamily)
MDTDDTLRRIRAGDRQAFAELVRRYQGPLFGFLGNMGLSYAQAQDLAQETFLRAWRSLPRYDSAAARFSTWLFTIARNLALNELGRASSRLETAAGEEIADHNCERPQPPEAIELDGRRRGLHAALRRLPASDRSVLALAYLRELDMCAIARIEGITTGAVKTRLHRARARLSQLLENDHA